MSAAVAERWGGHEVSHVTLASIVRAQAAAARQGDVTVSAELARAVLMEPRAHAVAALTALGVRCDELAARLAAGPASVDPANADGFDARLRGLLAAADRRRECTGDPHITSVHLLAALADAPEPALRPLRDAGIGLDLLLTGAARNAAPVEPDDTAFRPPAPPAVVSTPATPALAELKTRTPARRSAVLARLLNSYMPAGPNATASNYGKVRADRWAAVHIAHQVLTIVVLPAGVGFGARWWVYPLLLGSCATPPLAWTPIWCAAVAGATLFAPAPVAGIVLLTALVGGVEAWYELWMKMVDLARPTLSMRELRLATRQTAVAMVFERLGIADDD